MLLRRRRDLWMVLIAVVVAIVLNFMMNVTSPDQPYYSTAQFNPFMALSVASTCLTHAWVLLIYPNQTLFRPLPKPSENNNRNEIVQRRKVAIVTGSNTGIGFETAKTLVVDYGWQVVLACRTRDKALQAMQDINNSNNNNEKATSRGGEAVVLEQALDLSSFESVQKFATAVQAKYPHVDVLINNAGRNTSGKSGEFDLMFQSNFLGHFLLTKCLLTALKNGGRIINLSSVMHHFSGAEPKNHEYWKSMALYSEEEQPGRYAASKLAAILFTQELNRRYGSSHGISSLAANPGTCASDIWRGFPGWLQPVFRLVFLTPQQGSAPAVAAAVHDDWGDETYLQPYWMPTRDDRPPIPFTEIMGPYVGHVPTTPRLPPGGGLAEARVLWEVSEELTSGSVKNE